MRLFISKKDSFFFLVNKKKKTVFTLSRLGILNNYTAI